ncbi:hypothetical protein [Mucilaginibacter sp. AK015]|uniref:hypothetical protein n=1 Tax=Mucilaginibacter sp. AK015 TaxID=2723072 RepID=UPI00160D2605|nr:hypothetical protein [Mucilaginibacter sp. AK015]MBB5395102.1 Tfp pilus assembly protein PilE [Mucilaginibacter sp. AK015]
MAKVAKVGRLKADSLLEVVIAAVLIIVVFSMAMMVYANVLHTSRPVKQVRAAAFLRQAARRIEQLQDTAVSETGFDGPLIRRSVTAAGGPGTAHLRLIALGAHNDTLAVLDKIIVWHGK